MFAVEMINSQRDNIIKLKQKYVYHGSQIKAIYDDIIKQLKSNQVWISFMIELSQSHGKKCMTLTDNIHVLCI